MAGPLRGVQSWARASFEKGCTSVAGISLGLASGPLFVPWGTQQIDSSGHHAPFVSISCRLHACTPGGNRRAYTLGFTLEMIGRKFGPGSVEHIKEMASHQLIRKHA